MYSTALKIAIQAHSGQFRKQSCVPYIVHPLRVANSFNDNTMKSIAILHDVIEDTDITLEYLSKLGFPGNVITALDALTKRDGEEHFEYIKRLRNNKEAIQVKIADIVDNLSDTITICPKSMVARYDKSLKMLVNFLN